MQYLIWVDIKIAQRYIAIQTRDCSLTHAASYSDKLFWHIEEIQYCGFRARPTERGGGVGDTSPGPQNFQGAPWGFYFDEFYLSWLLFLYLSLSWHCLDSMSEHLGSNDFTVSVDKHFDACKHQLWYVLSGIYERPLHGGEGASNCRKLVSPSSVEFSASKTHLIR